MVERNGSLRLFRCSVILGQPHEVDPKFRNDNFCSIRYQPGISGIFGRMESAHVILVFLCGAECMPD